MRCSSVFMASGRCFRMAFCFLFLFTAPSLGAEWDACSKVFEADRPINHLPMYGLLKEHTAAHKLADLQFIQKTKEIGSLEEGSRHAAKRGGEAFRKGDLETAIKRFNQAWLLDKGNGDAYWGFAVIVWERDKDFDCARLFFEKAAEILPEDPNLWCDFGRFYMINGQMDKAVEYASKAVSMQDDVCIAHFVLTKAYLGKGAYHQALEHARIAYRYGQIIDRPVLDALTCAVKMKDEGKSDEEISTTCGP